MELSTRVEIYVPVRSILRAFVLFLFIMVGMPYFFNLGSSEIGCPMYEWRTGEPCYSILN